MVPPSFNAACKIKKMASWLTKTKLSLCSSKTTALEEEPVCSSIETNTNTIITSLYLTKFVGNHHV